MRLEIQGHDQVSHRDRQENGLLGSPPSRPGGYKSIALSLLRFVRHRVRGGKGGTRIIIASRSAESCPARLDSGIAIRAMLDGKSRA
jgi:hypothetical protein